MRVMPLESVFWYSHYYNIYSINPCSARFLSILVNIQLNYANSPSLEYMQWHKLCACSILYLLMPWWHLPPGHLQV